MDYSKTHGVATAPRLCEEMATRSGDLVPNPRPEDFYRSYGDGEGLSLAQFKQLRFAEAVDQVAGEIAEGAGIDLAEFSSLSDSEKYKTWDAVLGDVAEEAYEYRMGANNRGPRA